MELSVKHNGNFYYVYPCYAQNAVFIPCNSMFKYHASKNEEWVVHKQIKCGNLNVL